MAEGRFITLEGGEGAGKSTQARLLAERLRAAGADVLLTREPGGTAFAEAIRAVLIGAAAEGVDPAAEALAHFAARADHVARGIRPALAAGRHVVSDRFLDSTYAYQAVAGGLGRARFDAIRAAATGAFRPDLTLLLDLPAPLGMARARDANRYERLGAAFHAAVRGAFRELATAEPDRCVMVDAAGSVEEVAGRVAAVVRAHLGLPL